MMIEKAPSVSVCMSTLNEVADGTKHAYYADSTLGNAIYSLCRQTTKSWELIVVGDKTEHEARIDVLLAHVRAQLACSHPEAVIRFENLDERGGGLFPGVRPKQRAVSDARSDLLAFLDPDNVYTDNRHLEKCISLLRNQPDVDLIYCDSILECKPTGLLRLPIPWRRHAWSHASKRRLMNSNFIDMSDAVFRKRAYEMAGGLKETMPYAMDWQLWRDMLASGADRFLYSPHYGIRYRTGTLQKHFEMVLTSFAERLRVPYSLEAVIDKKREKLQQSIDRSQQKFAA